MILKRTRWHLRDLDRESGYRNYNNPQPEPDIERANLIGSLLPNGQHGPCIDLDFPCRLIPSRTPGHFHLYLEQETDWAHYEQILLALVKAGYVQLGFYEAAVKYKQTFVRPPQRLSPTCTTVPPAADEVLELIDVVRAIVGTGPPRDELDKKIACLEDRVYSIMAAKIDAIVARRIERGMAAVPSEELSEGSDGADGPPGDADVRRVFPLRRKH